MSSRNFMELLQARWDLRKFVCVGLDSDPRKLPQAVPGPAPQLTFNQDIVDATRDIVCAYKPNLAFYRGAEGKNTLAETVSYIRTVAPDIPIILDAKLADIGNTNAGYVEEVFDWIGVDAVTIHPYLGMEAVRPFLDRPEKGIIVLSRTSNPGAGEFQNPLVSVPLSELSDGLPRPRQWLQDLDPMVQMPMYKYIAHQVAYRWNYNGNCAVVSGAPYPDELAAVRRIVGDLPILIPGIGVQGGELEATIMAGRDDRGQGMIVNSSRGIIFASSGDDYAEAARAEAQRMHDQITEILSRSTCKE